MSVIEYFTIEELVYLRTVINTVSKTTGVTVEHISSKSKNRNYVFARHLFLYFAHKNRYSKSLTTTKIARYVGRDHSTYIYARNEIKKSISINDRETLYSIAIFNRLYKFLVRYTIMFEEIQLTDLIRSGDKLSFNIIHEDYSYLI